MTNTENRKKLVEVKHFKTVFWFQEKCGESHR